MHLRCAQCSILLHLIDICFLTCICLWQISHPDLVACVFALTLCRYDLREGDLFSRVGPWCDECVLGVFFLWYMKYFIVLSLCDYGGAYCYEVGIYVLFCNCVWLCVDVCCVSCVVECSLFLESGSVVCILLPCVIYLLSLVLLSDL